MRYIVLDMEWNQPWNTKKAIREPIYLKGEIIQIGAVKLDEHFNIIDTFKVLISPCYYKKMHSMVSKLTKIKTSTLKSGLPFVEAFELFKTWCEEDFVFLVWGWDDIPMLKDNMTVFGADREWLPKWYNVQTLYDLQIAKEGRQHSLSDAMERLGEPPIQAHDALNDAYGTARVCLHLDMQKGFEDYVAVEIKRRTEKLKLIKEYPLHASVERDSELYSFTCPMCNKSVECDDMNTYDRGSRIGIAKCGCGGEFLIRLKRLKKNETTIRIDRTVYPLDETNRELYNVLLEENNKEIAHA